MELTALVIVAHDHSFLQVAYPWGRGLVLDIRANVRHEHTHRAEVSQDNSMVVQELHTLTNFHDQVTSPLFFNYRGLFRDVLV